MKDSSIVLRTVLVMYVLHESMGVGIWLGVSCSGMMAEYGHVELPACIPGHTLEGGRKWNVYGMLVYAVDWVFHPLSSPLFPPLLLLLYISHFLLPSLPPSLPP